MGGRLVQTMSSNTLTQPWTVAEILNSSILGSPWSSLKEKIGVDIELVCDQEKFELKVWLLNGWVRFWNDEFLLKFTWAFGLICVKFKTIWFWICLSEKGISNLLVTRGCLLNLVVKIWNGNVLPSLALVEFLNFYNVILSLILNFSLFIFFM